MAITVGLFVEGTFLPSFEGATRRFSGLARHLAAAGVSVVVFHRYRGWSDIKLISNELFYTYFLPESIYYGNEALISLLRQEKIDIAILSDFEAVCTIGTYVRRHLPHLRLFFEAHDHAFNFHKSLSASYDRLLDIRSAERYAFELVDIAVCFSRHDYDHFKDDYFLNSDPVERLFSVPFGCAFSISVPFGPNLALHNVVFLGNMFHKPNSLALEALLTNVAPAVIRGQPNTRFLIVGDTPEQLKAKYDAPWVEFLGKVPDLNQVFSKSTVAVAPIFHGSGIKVKLLDYCSAGLPIICSSSAANGISDSRDSFIIEDNINNYCDHILTLFSDPARATELGKLAFECCERHSWYSVSLELCNLYKACLNEPAKALPEELSLGKGKLTPYYLSDYFSQTRFQIALQMPSKVLKGGFGITEEISSLNFDH